MNLIGKKYIGEGTYGICYELTNKDILKIFKIPKDKTEIKKMEKFSKIDTKTIIFPKELIANKSTLFGYTMRRANGKELYENFRNYDLGEASLNTVNLERDIINISKMGIEMYDIHSENVFYDGFNYSVIDTDPYYYSDYNKDDLEYLNLKKFYSIFIDLFIMEFLNINYYYDKHYKFFTKLRLYETKDYELNQLINLLKIETENYLNFSIEKLSDIEKLKRR